MQTDPETLRRQCRQLHDQLTQAQQQAQAQSVELTLLRELAEVLQFGQDFENTCRHLLHTIINNTVAQNCSIMLVDPSNERFFLAGATDPERKNFALPVADVIDPVHVGHGFKLGEGAAGKALASKQVVLIEDVLASDQFVAHPATQVAIGCLLCVPLIFKEDAFGVLNLSHSKPHAFQSQDLYQFNIVANFVARAIHNALAQERLQHALKEGPGEERPPEDIDPTVLLANGITHDLNNVLAGLVGYSELLELQLGGDERFKTTFSAIQEAGLKATEIIGNLAALGELEIDEEDPMDLSLVIRQYLFDSNFRALVDAHPDVIFDHTLEEDLPKVQGRMEGLLKALDKFFCFAYEATGEKGRIAFTICVEEIDARSHPKARRCGPHIALRLKFGGPALRADDIRHLFIPYFAKNRLGFRSGGLGLAAAARIVELHHGWTDVTTNETGGNRICAYLPVWQPVAGGDA